nr:hypothetical protein [Fodinicola feengrottensis]
MNATDPGRRLAGVGLGAVRGDADELGRTHQPPPRVGPKVRVLRDPAHRGRVQRLQEQCP